MKTKLLLLLGLSLCYLGEQTAMGQTAPGSPPNAGTALGTAGTGDYWTIRPPVMNRL